MMMGQFLSLNVHCHSNRTFVQMDPKVVDKNMIRENVRWLEHKLTDVLNYHNIYMYLGVVLFVLGQTLLATDMPIKRGHLRPLFCCSCCAHVNYSLYNKMM